jgi:hypothetical protein
MSLYQGPFWAAMSIPARFQSSSSAICVPDLSPREMNETRLSFVALKAAKMSFDPLTPAGSFLHHGKALYAEAFCEKLFLGRLGVN